MSEVRRARGAAARLAGRRAELVAALWLMARGYRILGLRLRTPVAEIDLLVRRGRVLAAVEVKTRTTIEASLAAVTADQRGRLRRALQAYAGARPWLKDAALRLDLMALAPGRFPRHIADAWTEDPPFR
jgi:putative endonuclease